MSNYCNEHFISIDEKTEHKINLKLKTFKINISCENFMFLTSVDENKIITHYQTLKNNCNSCVNGLCSRTITGCHQ